MGANDRTVHQGEFLHVGCDWLSWVSSVFGPDWLFLQDSGPVDQVLNHGTAERLMLTGHSWYCRVWMRREKMV